ncbi:MAG: universal stress protein [Sandaracinaceae bacterium]|nr:universal stress protein [Sandaracinaceae bacterium]
MLAPRVLCPLVLGDPAERTVLEYAIELAAHLNSSVQALHVYDLGNEPGWSAAPGYVRGAEQSARHVLDEHLRGLGADSTMVSSRFLEGAAHARVLEEAARLDVDFIVMGTRGRRGVGRLVFGSVAARVLGATRCPVITVPFAKLPAVTISSILVAHDLSSIASNRALELARRVQLAAGSPPVRVLHVLPVAEPVADHEQHRWDATRQLEREIDRCFGPEWRDLVTLRVVEGDPLDQILGAQRQGGADLLAIGTSSKPPVVRLALGSVAVGLLSRCQVPVLVAPRLSSAP